MKKMICAVLALCLMLALSVTAFANSVELTEAHVTFTAGDVMDSDYAAAEVNSALSVLQPGDDMTVKLYLKNENAENVDWYMTNEVIYSLEDRSHSANGGAYTYLLTYTSVAGETYILYSSDTVGGEESVNNVTGLHEATRGLEDFFYLETMQTGESGYITLYVALDGETQGNDYQNTLANLQMNFAVEKGTELPGRSPLGTDRIIDNEVIVPGGSPDDQTNVKDIVKTGDDMDLLPYYIAMAGSGALFLLLAVDSLRRRKKGGGSR